MTNYKCLNCFLIMAECDTDIEVLPKREVRRCPDCCAEVVPMCSHDHICFCNGQVMDGTKLCPECGEYVCQCGSHDCEVLSRITGYYGSLKGWNKAKAQELKDRTRSNVGADGAISPV